MSEGPLPVEEPYEEFVARWAAEMEEAEQRHRRAMNNVHAIVGYCDLATMFGTGANYIERIRDNAVALRDFLDPNWKARTAAWDEAAAAANPVAPPNSIREEP